MRELIPTPYFEAPGVFNVPKQLITEAFYSELKRFHFDEIQDLELKENLYQAQMTTLYRHGMKNMFIEKFNPRDEDDFATPAGEMIFWTTTTRDSKIELLDTFDMRQASATFDVANPTDEVKTTKQFKAVKALANWVGSDKLNLWQYTNDSKKLTSRDFQQTYSPNEMIMEKTQGFRTADFAHQSESLQRWRARRKDKGLSTRNPSLFVGNPPTGKRFLKMSTLDALRNTSETPDDIPFILESACNLVSKIDKGSVNTNLKQPQATILVHSVASMLQCLEHSTEIISFLLSMIEPSDLSPYKLSKVIAVKKSFDLFQDCMSQICQHTETALSTKTQSNGAFRKLALELTWKFPTSSNKDDGHDSVFELLPIGSQNWPKIFNEVFGSSKKPKTRIEHTNGLQTPVGKNKRDKSTNKKKKCRR